MTRRSGFELWGATLARVLTPFLGMGLLLHEVVLREDLRPLGIMAGFLALAGYEAVIAAVKRTGHDRGTGTSAVPHADPAGDVDDSRGHTRRARSQMGDLTWA